MTPGDDIESIYVRISAFGMPYPVYVEALRELLALPDAVKQPRLERYLDVILEILFRVQDSFRVPWLDEELSEELRLEAQACLHDRDQRIISAARDVIENLPPKQ